MSRGNGEVIPVSLRDAVVCQSELKAFAELLRLTQYDLHSLKPVDELDIEVRRAVNSFNSLSTSLGYERVDVSLVNSMIIRGVQTDWFKKVRAHEHGILKLDRCVFPMVQIEPRRYFLPHKNSFSKDSIQNVIEDGKLIIGTNSSAVIRLGRKLSSLDGEVIHLSAEELEFIGSMDVSWVNRVISEKETITVLEVSHSTSSRMMVMVNEKEALFSRTFLSPVSATITNPSRINYEGLSDIILTYFILGSELHHIDTSAAIGKVVELVDKAITLQENGQVADINVSVFFRGLEGLTARNKGLCGCFLAVSDRSRRAEIRPVWNPVVGEENLLTSDKYLSSYDESQITIRGQWPWATILTFVVGAAAVLTLVVLKLETILKAIPDYVTLFIFLLIGMVATVHNIRYAQWPFHDAVRGIVTSNNTEKLERFLGKEEFVRMILSIKRPDVVFDEHKSCLLAPVRKGKVIFHRMIKYGEVRKYGVSILFNNYFEPVFRKGNQFRKVSIENEVVHIGAVIPAQDLISREIPGEYRIGLEPRGERNV